MDAAEIIKLIFIFLSGAAVTKLVELLFKRFFPNAEERAAAEKTQTDAAHVSMQGGLQAFQVADESLTEWIQTARTATKELLVVSRKLHEIEMICDDVCKLLEKALAKMRDCEVDGLDELHRELEALKAERRKMSETK